MFHNTDKDLSTTILTVKGDRIILETESLASIMGIRDKGNTVTIDFNRESIDENPDWSYEETSNNLEIRPRPGDWQHILHGGDFPQLLCRALTYFFGHFLLQKGGG